MVSEASRIAAALMCLSVCALLAACESSSSSADDTDSGADGDADSDSDADADTDTNPCDPGPEWTGPGSGMCEVGAEGVQYYGDGGVLEAPLGIERCQDGSLHRFEAVACMEEYEAPPCDTCNEVDGGCPEGEVCHFADSWDTGCFCMRPCVSDDDCESDQLCLCPLRGLGDAVYGSIRSSLQRCVPASCRTDADCGGYRCGVDYDDCGVIHEIRCRGPEDECEGYKDCPQFYDETFDECVDPSCEFHPGLSIWQCLWYEPNCTD